MTEPELSENLTDHIDVVTQILCAQISDDYLAVIKKFIKPHLSGFGDMGLRELRVLMCIAFHAKGITPTQIANVMSYDRATVTRAVTRLMSGEYIKQSRNNLDTRSHILTLKPRGHELAAAYKTATQTFYSDFEGAMDAELSTDEKQAFLDMLSRLKRRSGAIRKWAVKASSVNE